jgi:hypothetical protein
MNREATKHHLSTEAVDRAVLRLLSDSESLYWQDIPDERITALPPLSEKLLVF